MSDKNPKYINYSRFTINRVMSPSEWYAYHLLTPIALSMPHKTQTYNWHDYKNAWFNFMYIRPAHTWFIKYCQDMANTVIPRGFENFQIKEQISTLLRKGFFIFYCGTLLRQSQIESMSKPQVKVSPRAASPSKNALKEIIKKALKEMDDDQSIEEDIMLLLEEVTSEKDNGDMLDPTRIDAAYIDSY
ncbi:hypothetical protein H5410_061039 [Solanum commersonii]|uniref:Uncharacterized protein n=1 Tax=Solanum commersonii TaxID=4109 RepID=A0A9J5W720_SOLCO|nr:hypothetical protein H5410_061039 [Solanum commersonii]